MTDIIHIQNLTIHQSRRPQDPLVKGLDLAIPKGQVLGIIGESGSGKSLSMKAVMGLIGKGLSVSFDRFLFQGKTIENGKNLPIAMIFQDPMTSLNPLRKIGYHLEEILVRFQPELSATERKQEMLALLDRVGISEGEKRLRQYPFEFSGGMRQRILIAMALLAKPDVIIADEPTTALDVTVQAQILSLIKELQEELGLTVVVVSHDFGVIAGISDQVMVMRSGQCLESGKVDQVFNSPAHNYTQSLLKAAQLEDGDYYISVQERMGKLVEIEPGHYVREVESSE
ncbi:ABC transporter ATP-binding protein [Streptococcus suis]|uniref:ABC transporter ATP-binding protein n=1 Tax=Streptococcus suis TaxID=1307 RepID=UPI001ABE4A0C|nr:ABC transporter ATP-binding protein [Streptococcus suis]